ncbi:MAG: hypothetical protein K8T20_00215 [Planctomycetes bacterium]|nr:hypothetical protein [Planctomycetota bacterium]
MQKLAVLAAAFALTTVLVARADDDKKKMDTPEKCLEAYKAAAVKSDGKGMMECFSAASRKKLVEHAADELKDIQATPDATKEAAEALGVKAEDLAKMTAEDYIAVKLSAMTKKDKETIEKTKFEVAKTDGDKAIATIDEGKKHKEKMVLVKKDGVWGIDLEETQKLDEGDEGGEDEGEEEGSGSK